MKATCPDVCQVEKTLFFLEATRCLSALIAGMLYIAVAILAYFLGSIPWGFLAGRINGIDLRQEGSGSTGATNAVRVLGKKWGYPVFVLDALKGWLAVMAGYFLAWPLFGGGEREFVTAGVVAAIFAMLGHTYPVWLRFQGGKGIATSAGIMLALFPIEVFGFGLFVWVLLFFTTRYVSLASLGAAVALPTAAATMWYLGECDAIRTGIAVIMCVLAIWRHKSNISRLIAGTEKRFEKKLRPLE
jgi:glycerol-3-phosphate acyltransferase PlsY